MQLACAGAQQSLGNNAEELMLHVSSPGSSPQAKNMRGSQNAALTNAMIPRLLVLPLPDVQDEAVGAWQGDWI